MSLLETIAASGVAVALLFRRGYRSSILAYLGAYFAFFAFGPVINVIRGEDIYSGTVESFVDEVAISYLLVLVAWLIVDLLNPEKLQPELVAQRIRSRRGSFWALRILLIPSMAFGLYNGLRIAQAGAFDKGASLGVAGPFHYPYLLLESLLLCTLFFVWHDKATRRLLALNAVVYTGYCFVGSERDFIFLFFTLILHAVAYGLIRQTKWLPVLAGGFAALGSWLFAVRGSGDFDLTQVLNQGSLLFVDTFLLSRSPIDDPEATTSLLRAFTLEPSTRAGSMSEWFVDLYSKHTGSGYGFSLVGESRMNFGLIGVPVVFFLLGLLHRRLLRLSFRKDWALYFSPLFTSTLMYSLRGDMRTFFITMVYGAVLFAGVSVFRRHEDPEPVPSEAVGAHRWTPPQSVSAGPRSISAGR